ncbi:phosphatidylglycerophosphatase [Cricetibacter osteomyelitidis]|uniref:undecaprenyl-diphosphate phosphatase n=1 Tax=Cricetibacter osteomyelitidis TaxID=1521931 RepID=A0A4R2TJU8_9PAST|nr:phosphatase PAP2 family protein [Cricetibacter osteomyelitidis]TCP95112.1 phosphatidylglycerophosphatase [Cricetibacter osteomyelitidis]
MIKPMIKRLSLYTLLLCLVPFFVWIFAWQWNGDIILTAFDQNLYWLTETGSMPYAVITSTILGFALMWLSGDKKYYKLIFFTALFAILGTQAIKSGLKAVFAEPRPYVMEIMTQHNLFDEQFYAVPRAEREKIVSEFYRNKSVTPHWLKTHRENETGYSFPSGHSIFAATWLMLFVGFAYLFKGQRRQVMPVAVVFMACWAVLMLISRLRLGMHYPVDLLVSTLIAWLLNIGIFCWISKKFDFI